MRIIFTDNFLPKRKYLLEAAVINALRRIRARGAQMREGAKNGIFVTSSEYNYYIRKNARSFSVTIYDRKDHAEDPE